MQVKARLGYLRIAPRKVRLVVDMIRGKKAVEAVSLLDFATKKASLPVSKLLKQALANAKNNFQLDENNLYISKITVDEGPKQKRWQPRARGQAYEIQKKSSHINLVLDELKPTAKKARRTKAAKIEVPVVESEKEMKETVQKEKAPRFVPSREVLKPKRDVGIKRIFRRKSI